MNVRTNHVERQSAGARFFIVGGGLAIGPPMAAYRSHHHVESMTHGRMENTMVMQEDPIGRPAAAIHFGCHGQFAIKSAKDKNEIEGILREKEIGHFLSDCLTFGNRS